MNKKVSLQFVAVGAGIGSILIDGVENVISRRKCIGVNNLTLAVRDWLGIFELNGKHIAIQFKEYSGKLHQWVCVNGNYAYADQTVCKSTLRQQAANTEPEIVAEIRKQFKKGSTTRGARALGEKYNIPEKVIRIIAA